MDIKTVIVTVVDDSFIKVHTSSISKETAKDILEAAITAVEIPDYTEPDTQDDSESTGLEYMEDAPQASRDKECNGNDE